MQCPLIYDGAFGLTKAKHSIQLCPLDRAMKRNLLSHFKQAHKLKGIHARRLYQAVRNGLDPKTTKLFSENEIVVDYDRFIPCPFSSSVIHLIGCCPQFSHNIPCQTEFVDDVNLKLHLRQHHRIPSGKAIKIMKSYRMKLSKIRSPNVNGNNSF
jgi:hypothetical protein